MYSEFHSIPTPRRRWTGWTVLKRHWLNSLLTVSAILLLAAAVGKTVTYGWSHSAQAMAVAHQATHVPKSLALLAVLAELFVAACLVMGPGSRRLRCCLLFLLCCCFVGYRLLRWGDAPCGCYVNPALLNAAGTRVLEWFASGSLLYMLLGRALALLTPEPAPASSQEACP